MTVAGYSFCMAAAVLQLILKISKMKELSVKKVSVANCAR